jgi:hypothetical protein
MIVAALRGQRSSELVSAAENGPTFAGRPEKRRRRPHLAVEMFEVARVRQGVNGGGWEHARNVGQPSTTLDRAFAGRLEKEKTSGAWLHWRAAPPGILRLIPVED